jgi:glyoxylase-like metal-dependent hydrolase (beta-lactamase superfamily II)
MNKIYIVCWFNYGELNQQTYQTIKRLYKMLPDSTKVYPGHGKSTDIGSEKKENTRVRLDTETE